MGTIGASLRYHDAMSIGPQVGRFRIIRRLSVGGMGEVYLAEDENLHRKVAFKVLPPEWVDDPDRLERFQWEAQVLATLNHPNIVTIYSVEHDDGLHYFTMELVEGDTLRDLIPTGGMGWERFLELAVPLADALASAHERGLIHRDVKPGNVMVRPDGRVKVLDFGLAKREPGLETPVDGDESSDEISPEPRTADGQFLGTVAYMSPEQRAGQAIDHRADLFSLGVVFYEMLTGERPFEDPDWGERLREKLGEMGAAAGPPDPRLPKRLEDIVLHSLKKLPEERYQDAADLRRDLEELQLELVSGAYSSTQIVRPRFTARRRRMWTALAVAIFLTLGAVGTALWHFSARDDASRLGQVAEKPARIVVLPFVNLGDPEDSYFAIGLSEEITSRLATVSASALRVVVSRQLGESGTADIARIGETLDVDYVLEGAVRWSGDDDPPRARVTPRLVRVSDGEVLWTETYDRVTANVLAVQSEIAAAVIGELGFALPQPWRAAPTAHPEAYQAYLRGMEYATRHDPTRENWDLAVAMLERAVRLDPEFAVAWAELARVHAFHYKQNLDPTEDRLERSREAALKSIALAPDLPDGHRALGYYHYWGRGDYERALEEFAIAAAGMPNDSLTIEGMAYVRRRQGHFDEAVAGFEDALELHPDNAWLAAELAHTFTHLRRYEKAEHYYDRAITLTPDQPLPFQLKALNVLRWTGDVNRARAILDEMPAQKETSSLYARFRVETIARNYDAALAYLREIESDLIGLDASLFPKSLVRAAVYQLRGDAELAESDYENARRTLEAKVRERPDEARLRSTLGLVYAGLGMKAEAVREGRRAVELRPIEDDAFIGPEYLELLAAIYAWVGDEDEALDLIERLLAMPSKLSRASLAVHPRWDPLRGNPRFERLLR